MFVSKKKYDALLLERDDWKDWASELDQSLNGDG